MVGIQTTSFVAVLGAASLSIGLALQVSLSNFAGGVLILLFRPFRVGDYVSSASGAAGTIEKIDILYTTMRTADGIAVFRSEERRVGKECVSTCRSRWSPFL